MTGPRVPGASTPRRGDGRPATRAALVVGRTATGASTHAGHGTGYALCGVLLEVETSTPFGSGPDGRIPAGSVRQRYSSTCSRCYARAVER